MLVRHGLIDPKARRRKRSDYKRWERARSMELWQMDLVGGVMLTDGSKLQVLTGIDGASRFCVSARMLVRATARPVCTAFAAAMRGRPHGVPEEVLTDNGKVFESIAVAQTAIDEWMERYNTVRPHQGIGMVTPPEGRR